MSDTSLGSEHLDELIFGHLRYDFVSLNSSFTVRDALDALRSHNLGERIVYFYVVDDEGRLEGVLPTRRLLMASADTPLRTLMVRDVVTLPSSATVREAVDLFVRHRLLALPVTDAAGHLHGIAEVSLFAKELAAFERQAAQDVFQLIGIHRDRQHGAVAGFRDRFPWLLANVAGGLLAAAVASVYDELLAATVVLALFIPVVLALAESVSIQSVTLTLQSLHGHRTGLLPEGRSLSRELVTAGLLGAGCGSIVGLIAGVWHGSPWLALVIAGAITASMVTASVLGILLPSLLHWLKRDPHIAAGPIVLAIADMVTLLFYFNLASALLTGL
jgi:magnesium transporter